MDRIDGPFCLELDYIKLRETFHQPKYFIEHAEGELVYWFTLAIFVFDLRDKFYIMLFK